MKKAFQTDFLTGSKPDYQLIAAILLVATIPLGYAVSNAALGFFVAASIVSIQQRNISVNAVLLLPVGLFILMCLSMLWSINLPQSLKALSKNLPFLLIPICFMIRPMSRTRINTLIKYYSGAMALYALWYILRAIVRFSLWGNSNVFFYHELTTTDVNAVHISLYMSVAFFYCITRPAWGIRQYITAGLLGLVIVLLSSKSLIITIFALTTVYFLFLSRHTLKFRAVTVAAGIFSVAIFILAVPKIRERFMIEAATMFTANTYSTVNDDKSGTVYNVTLDEALNKESFHHAHYIPGVALRVFQARVFAEMAAEDNIWLYGYGLNASQDKVRQKVNTYNLHPGYGEFNFHNQYIQNFAELGIAGLLILLAMLAINVKNAFHHKDFIHISLAILLITLFLTESLLSRQRGIIFFTMFYCLFNAYPGKWRAKIKEL